MEEGGPRMKKLKKSYEELELRDDFMFGVIMRNPLYCKKFLEIVLGMKISNLEYPEAQKTIDLSPGAKDVRLDIYVEDEEHTAYNLEMQSRNRGNMPKRMRYYQGMIDLNTLEKGALYKTLKRSIIIFVCTFDLFGYGRHIYTFENRCIETPDLSMDDGVSKVVLNTKGTQDDISLDLKNLLNYIDGKPPMDDYTRELDRAVQLARSDEKRRLEYMTLEMHLLESYEEGREDGLELGMERGLEQGQGAERTEMAERMLRAGKYTTDEIVFCTTLTREQVEGLQKQL